MLSIDDRLDLIAATLDYYPRNRYVDIAQEYSTLISSRLIKKFNVTYPGGAHISWMVNYRYEGNAQSAGLYPVINPRREDTLLTAKVPWKRQLSHFMYDINEEKFQSDAETIVRLTVIGMNNMKKDMAQLVERQTWSAPTSASSDDMYGIPWWIQRDITVPAGGFTGGNPDGFTTTAEIDASTITNWRNWAGQYVSVTPEDLINTIKSAIRDCEFESPIDFAELKYGESERQLFMTKDTIAQAEQLAETRNENLGPDVIRYMGQTIVAGIPTVYVPYLSNTATGDPVYGVNFGELRPYTVTGGQMTIDKPVQPYNQPGVRIVYMHNWMNWCCYNRRSQFVISKT